MLVKVLVNIFVGRQVRPVFGKYFGGREHHGREICEACDICELLELDWQREVDSPKVSPPPMTTRDQLMRVADCLVMVRL